MWTEKSDQALKEMKYKHLFSQECKRFKSRFSAHSVFIRVSILYHEDGRLNKGAHISFSVLDIKVKNVIFPMTVFLILKSTVKIPQISCM